MFDNAWDSATETWKFMGSMMLLHGAVNKIKQLPGYAVSQLKSFVNSADKGVPQTILDNLAKNKFLDPVEVEKTKKALEEHNVAADQTAALGITDEAAKGAISGKQEKKIKLQKEIDELQKNNITAGVEERLYQIDKLNKEIDEIYKTGNINQHEFDNQLPTQEDISQPIELSPELPEGYELPKKPTEVTTTPVTTTEVKTTEVSPEEAAKVEDTTQQTTTEVENIINTFQQSLSGYAKEDILTSGQKKSITLKANNAIKKLKSILGFDTGNLPSHTKEQSEALKNIQYLSSESKKFETIKDLFDQYAQDKLNNKETELTKAIDSLYEFKKENDAHVDALNQTIKNTEYEQQARNLGLREEPTGGTTAEVPTEPTGKPIEDATAPNEARATFEDAGYDSEQSARDAYESERDVATNQTYEEWLLEKYCG
jgi:hypothetical protein